MIPGWDEGVALMKEGDKLTWISLISFDETWSTFACRWKNETDKKKEAAPKVREIFDYIRHGEELVEQPFDRLIAANELHSYPHDGFTASMDTFKDKQHFDDLYAKGNAPWEVWRASARKSNGVFDAAGKNGRVSEQVAANGDPSVVKYKGPDDFLSILTTPPAEPPANTVPASR